jgi:hypothetical protein
MEINLCKVGGKIFKRSGKWKIGKVDFLSGGGRDDRDCLHHLTRSGQLAFPRGVDHESCKLYLDEVSWKEKTVRETGVTC